MTSDAFPRTVAIPAPFSLAATCGPVHWTTGRSPRHRWEHGVLTWIGWEADRIVWRQCHQVSATEIAIGGSADPAGDGEWTRHVLGSDLRLPEFPDEPMQLLAETYPGLRSYCDGSLFDGIVTSIVGQSISVAAAAVTQAKLAALFNQPVTIGGIAFTPLPHPTQLADAAPELVRSSGVTWKRAEALVFAAKELIAGNLPSDAFARTHPDETVQALMALPMVGRWTAESAILWGVGAPNAHPTGDVALLRAAKTIYDLPELTLKELDALAERWQPARGLAARLLWTAFFGPAPE